VRTPLDPPPAPPNTCNSTKTSSRMGLRNFFLLIPTYTFPPLFSSENIWGLTIPGSPAHPRSLEISVFLGSLSLSTRCSFPLKEYFEKVIFPPGGLSEIHGLIL